jgi:predicted DNA-binding helix-hairpin-helix protein
LSIRRYHQLMLDDLRKLNVRVKLAMQYLLTADHLPGIQSADDRVHDLALQLDLFAPVSAITGSL